MKTSISVPDDLFESADALAERMDVSRSRLYTNAVAEYLAKHRQSDVTAKLNEVYSENCDGLDEAVKGAQRRTLKSPEW